MSVTYFLTVDLLESFLYLVLLYLVLKIWVGSLVISYFRCFFRKKLYVLSLLLQGSFERTSSNFKELSVSHLKLIPSLSFLSFTVTGNFGRSRSDSFVFSLDTSNIIILIFFLFIIFIVLNLLLLSLPSLTSDYRKEKSRPLSLS